MSEIVNGIGALVVLAVYGLFWLACLAVPFIVALVGLRLLLS